MSAGGAASVVGWVVGGIFALIVAASLGQIASAYPTAGGLYHWSSILGGRFWGWATAWVNLLGLIFVVASVDVGVYQLFRDLVYAGVFGGDTKSWMPADGAVFDLYQTIGVTIIVISQALFNHYGIRVTTMLTDFSGYLIFVVAVVLVAVMLIFGATHDWSRIFQFTNNTGDLGGGFYPSPRSALVAFLVGLLYPLYTMTGYDGSAHTSEETVNARVSVPNGMVHSVFWSLLFGLAMAISFIMAMPDPAAGAKDGSNSWFNLFNNLPMPAAFRGLLAIAIVVSNYLCALAAVTSTSRMIFAFARGDGLPGSAALKSVSPTHRSPTAAIWTTAALTLAATLYSPAFAALAAGCALFLYISYAMPIGAGLLAEGKSWTTFGPFRLGVWSKVFAAITLIGVLILMFAGIQPPNDILINYALGLIVVLAVAWFGLESRRFQGPPIGDAILKRQAAIAAAEKALGGAV
jgi:amino acid transporter